MADAGKEKKSIQGRKRIGKPPKFQKNKEIPKKREDLLLTKRRGKQPLSPEEGRGVKEKTLMNGNVRKIEKKTDRTSEITVRKKKKTSKKRQRLKMTSEAEENRKEKNVLTKKHPSAEKKIGGTEKRGVLGGDPRLLRGGSENKHRPMVLRKVFIGKGGTTGRKGNIPPNKKIYW